MEEILTKLQIATAICDRQPTFLASASWINIPFSHDKPSPTQQLYSEIATLSLILCQIDSLDSDSSIGNEIAAGELIQTLLEAWRRLCNWESDLGNKIDFLGPRPITASQNSLSSTWFSTISEANGMTHCWSARVICLLEIDKLLQRLPKHTIIRKELPLDIPADGNRLVSLICASMEYLLQDEMKLFGPASAIFPAQIAHAWFKRHRARDKGGLDLLRAIVIRLVHKGLLSAPRLILGEDSL